ncbi:MAG: FAD:protein FMN transferase [Vicinamibacteria bacterium]
MARRRNAPFLLLLAAACSPRPLPPEESFEGEALGTTYQVRLAETLSESERVGVKSSIDSVFEEVSSKMSAESPDSDLSKLNRAPAGEELPVSIATLDVFREAVQVSELTGGAYDVTAGPLARAWESDSPAEEEIAAARARVGFRHLTLDDDSVTITKEVDSLECDLSGISRGYAVDRIAEGLEAEGYRSYRIDLGGDVRTRGKDAAGEAWRIPIEKPTAGERGIQRALSVSGLAVSTSKNPRVFGDPEGKPQPPLVDPRTARPLLGEGLASVTVLGESCMRAEALANGLMTLGPEEGYELAVREDLSVLFLLLDDGKVEEKATPAFADLFF